MLRFWRSKKYCIDDGAFPANMMTADRTKAVQAYACKNFSQFSFIKKTVTDWNLFSEKQRHFVDFQ